MSEAEQVFTTPDAPAPDAGVQGIIDSPDPVGDHTWMSGASDETQGFLQSKD